MAVTVEEIELQGVENLVSDRRRVWPMAPTRIVFVPCSLVEVEMVPDDEWQDSVLR
jgi:hypothetical protein